MLETSQDVPVRDVGIGRTRTTAESAYAQAGADRPAGVVAGRRPGAVDVVTRRARADDVRAIREIVGPLVAERRMLAVKPVSFYTSLQRFRVAEQAGRVVGCGALHVIWEDLAEIRTVAVRPHVSGSGVGSAVVRDLIEDARALGMRRVFCLTFETEFFARHGFAPIQGQAVSPEVYAEILHRYDHDMAHSLDLVSVKPNTLGNTCMLLTLDEPRRVPAASASGALPASP